MHLKVWKDIEKIRETSPLVHNITNFVVMNNTANALLSIGASPVMAHAIEEVADMASIASALVINIGTLSSHWIEAMKIAMQTARLKGIPIIIDPVGVGATKYRTQTVKELIAETRPSVIRGNASEIMALLDDNVKTKGVDSNHSSDNALSAATALANYHNCVVVVSGATDIITDGKQSIFIDNGHAMMPKVTGLGCTATAITGAFCAVNSDYLQACANAMATMSITGELAVKISNGPASLQTNFIDKLYNITSQEISQNLKYHE